MPLFQVIELCKSLGQEKKGIFPLYPQIKHAILFIFKIPVVTVDVGYAIINVILPNKGKTTGMQSNGQTGKKLLSVTMYITN